MADYDALVDAGDELRINHYKHKEAIEKYEAALVIGGPRDRHCRQMAGVCSRLMGRDLTAIKWFEMALEGANALESANIYRDMAEAHRALGDFGRAERLLHLALSALDGHPVEYAVTLGFMARVQADREDGLGSALYNFGLADGILSANGNRHVDLYNKLHYANCLSRCGGFLASRRMALKALRLSRDYGAPAHRQRAVALLVGGYRLDNLLRKPRH